MLVVVSILRNNTLCNPNLYLSIYLSIRSCTRRSNSIDWHSRLSFSRSLVLSLVRSLLICASNLSRSLALSIGVHSVMDERAIAIAFAPEVRLHSGEAYYPARVHWYLSRCALKLHTSDLASDPVVLPHISSIHELLSVQCQYHGGSHGSLGALDLPKATSLYVTPISSDTYAGEPDKLDQIPLYANLVYKTPTPSHEAEPSTLVIDLQYFFFYAYNGALLWYLPSAGIHEGDWEVGASPVCVLCVSHSLIGPLSHAAARDHPHPYPGIGRHFRGLDRWRVLCGARARGSLANDVHRQGELRAWPHYLQLVDCRRAAAADRVRHVA